MAKKRKKRKQIFWHRKKHRLKNKELIVRLWLRENPDIYSKEDRDLIYWAFRHYG